MKTNKTYHIIGLTFGMLIFFVFMILWTTQFELFELEDIRLFVILVIGTLILVFLGTQDLSCIEDLTHKFRFNLFLTAVLMSMMLLFKVLSDETPNVNGIMMSFKPMIVSLMIYLPVINILNKMKVQQKGDDFIAEDLSVLSRREQEVFSWALKGKSNKEISVELYIAETTVKKHMQNILKKLSCSDRHELMTRYKDIL